MAEYRQQPAATWSAAHARPRRTLRSALAVLAVALVIGAVSMAAALMVGGNARASRTGHVSASAGPTDPGTSDGNAGALDGNAGGSADPEPGASAAATAVAPTQAGPARTTLAPLPPQPPGNAGMEAQVLALVNQERAKTGCKPVTADAKLTAAARAHSEDMARRGFFDHTTPDGVDFATRIKNAGYKWSGAGENIAKGQKDPASVMKSWMNSPGHRANILNCGYKNLGVGLAFDAKHVAIWTQDFASPM